jgi:3-hydroxyisobutyrate dehydrogenase-like beta-hydroxyacid dehydrogenase
MIAGSQSLRDAGATPVGSAPATTTTTFGSAPATTTGSSATATITAKADVVCVCVFSDEQVTDVCLGDGLLDAMPAGSVLVVHTTGSPATVRSLEKRAPRGVGVIDCPVSGGPHDIAAGAITLLAGGAAEHVERAAPVLKAYGDPILHVGPLGAGQAVKLVNNAVFAASIGLLA